MALETRRLVFSREELISAALDFCRHGRIAVPEAEVERVELAQRPELTLVLSFRVNGPMDPDQLSLSGSQLVAALARFCKRNAIPLPRDPEKRLHCEDGKLSMLLQFEHRSRCKAAVPA